MVNVEPQLALKLNWNILLLLEKKNNYKLVIASHCHILLYIYMVTPRNVDETHTHTHSYKNTLRYLLSIQKIKSMKRKAWKQRSKQTDKHMAEAMLNRP